jgi:hypothetical protein
MLQGGFDGSNVAYTMQDKCPPHLWICTSIRIDGVSYTHMKCDKCLAEKDVPLYNNIADKGKRKGWR